MTGQPASEPTDSTSPPAGPPANVTSQSFAARIREHKILQWGIAYLGVALALGQGQELVADAFRWPDVIGRLLVVALVAGFPIALTVAWYHGHKGLQRISSGELMIVSVLVLIGALFFTVALRPGGMPAEAATDPAARATAVTAAAEPPRAPPLPNSVAVLPCENVSLDREKAYFADGFHIELLGQLQKLKSLNVTARTSVMQYANGAPPVAEIARQLNVENVMECAVSYAGDRVAVRTSLIDADKGTYLWSDSYNREFANVLEIQADVAMNVANALQAEFSGEEQARLERVPTKSPEAYDLYLQGLAIAPLAPANMVALMERSIAADANFAAPHAQLARNYSQRLVNTVSATAVRADERAELARSVERYAARALQLDPQQGAAHAALAMLQMLSWRWTDAEASFKNAIETAPPDELTASYYGFLLSMQGRNPEAISLGERAFRLNPAAGTGGPGLGFALGMAGRYEDAAAHLRKVLVGSPGWLLARHWLGLMELASGNASAALAEIETVDRALEQDRSLAFLPELAYAYARLGRSEDARRIVDEIAAISGDSVGAGTRAMASLAIGDRAQALEWLDVAAAKAERHEPDAGFVVLMNLKMNVTNDPVLKEPEFAAALARIRGD